MRFKFRTGELLQYKQSDEWEINFVILGKQWVDIKENIFKTSLIL